MYVYIIYIYIQYSLTQIYILLENLKRKLYNCNANIYFKQTCLINIIILNNYCNTRSRRLKAL